MIFNTREQLQKSYCHVKKGIKIVMTWTDQLLMTEKPTLCLNREWTSLHFLILVLLTVKHSQRFVECQESTCSSIMHPQYVLQMKPLKTWRELNVDYSVWITIVVEAILTGQSHLHFCCKFFLWRLKILKRQGVSFFFLHQFKTLTGNWKSVAS